MLFFQPNLQRGTQDGWPRERKIRATLSMDSFITVLLKIACYCEGPSVDRSCSSESKVRF
jgi:hypothetical protein